MPVRSQAASSKPSTSAEGVAKHLRGRPAIGVLAHHADDHQAAALRQRARARREHVAAHALPDQVDALRREIVHLLSSCV